MLETDGRVLFSKFWERSEDSQGWAKRYLSNPQRSGTFREAESRNADFFIKIRVVCQVLGGSKIWSTKPHFELQEISVPEGRRKEADHFKCCVLSTMEDVMSVGH